MVLRRVGLSGKRREDVFPYLSSFLDHLFGFLAASKRVGCGLEASWKPRPCILGAFWGVDRMFFLILEAILQPVAFFDTFS